MTKEREALVKMLKALSEQAHDNATYFSAYHPHSFEQDEYEDPVTASWYNPCHEATILDVASDILLAIAEQLENEYHDGTLKVHLLGYRKGKKMEILSATLDPDEKEIQKAIEEEPEYEDLDGEVVDLMTINYHGRM